MKLILCSDVKALGKNGDVVDVADGYARNFLLPRKLAAEADKGALAQLERSSRQRSGARRKSSPTPRRSRRASRRRSSAVRAKAGGNGKLFGAVTNADVADAIAGALASRSTGIRSSSRVRSKRSAPIRSRSSCNNVVAKATVDVVAA